MLGNPLVFERLAASQDGLSSMELVTLADLLIHAPLLGMLWRLEMHWKWRPQSQANGAYPALPSFQSLDPLNRHKQKQHSLDNFGFSNIKLQ
jgi:hypothetical protein